MENNNSEYAEASLDAYEKFSSWYVTDETIEGAILDDSFPNSTFCYIQLITCELESCMFRNLEFLGASVEGTTITSVTFELCDLSKSTFRNCTFNMTCFDNCKLEGAEFIDCEFTDCEFTGCDGPVDFGKSIFIDCNSTQSDFSDSDFSHCQLERSEFSNCEMMRTSFNKAIISKCDFEMSDLSESDILEKSTISDTKNVQTSDRYIHNVDNTSRTTTSPAHAGYGQNRYPGYNNWHDDDYDSPFYGGGMGFRPNMERHYIPEPKNDHAVLIEINF